MARNWTEEQKRVIELHNRNILVSAAAGSGKTAVLVERIIEMVTDPQQEIDIDRLVVVTFTKAAAGEMKQRISDAIEEKLLEDPDNLRMQRQLTLLNNSSITTIDSFCLNIVRNYFADADIDPGFRTADEGELKLLQSEVLGKILEEYYSGANQQFFDFVESFGTGRDDTAIEDIILRLYHFSRSYPWPLEWLEQCRTSYCITSTEEMNANPAVQYLCDYVKNIITDYSRKYETLLEICSEPDGPYMYQPMLVSDQEKIQKLLELDGFETMGACVRTITFDRLSSKKDDKVAPEKKEYVKSVRDVYKKSVTGLTKKIFVQDGAENLKDIVLSTDAVQMMIELAMRFYTDMQTAKRDKNIIDFNDMEHLALDILVKKENGEKIYTQAADSLSEFYEEILIDEYQDSNYLQEEILYSISKGRVNEAENNLFMVGDVKQSIYKFRLARPDIFTFKYNTYTDSDSQYQKIELSKNFRSRDTILHCINDVFFNIMRPFAGGIDYNSRVMLNPGREFPSLESNQNLSAEIFVINTSANPEADIDAGSEPFIVHTDTETADYAGRELEAMQASALIKQFVDEEDGFLVFDAEQQEYRKAKYSDIVILTRTVTGWAAEIVNILMNHGIPAYSDTSSGYFDTREIKLVMSMLSIIDNPLQDIPLTAVLLSYFGKFTTEELAFVRSNSKDKKMYEVLLEHSQENQRMAEFLENLYRYRKLSEHISIHDLIWKIVYDTGFYDYVGTMPAGERRQANVDMLMEKAASFANTSYRGLFHFLKYIEKIKKYDIDYGEASLLGENENLVRVMSIHKSKGLEFPIVILAGMGKKFNNMDASSNVAIDADLGIGAAAVNLEQRTKTPTIIKNAVNCKIKMDNLSEELRILYVALTRAKEKLILLGTVKNAEKSQTSWKRMSFPYDFADLESCGSYFDLVVPIAIRDGGNTGIFQVNIVEQSAIESMENMENVLSQKVLKDIKPIGDKSTELEESETENHFTIPQYPYENKAPMKAKITVTELKKMQYESDFDEEQVTEQFVRQEQNIEERTPIIPEFIAGTGEIQGNERGTAYHRIMECLDYGLVATLESVRQNILKMESTHKITEQQRKAVSAEKIFLFCGSSIGQRIKNAASGGKLRREQPFVYGIDREGGEMQLVQGIVDLYLTEGEQITIVDYKTDRVSGGIKGEEELVKRYKIQLDYYADAISRLTGKEVTQKIIYSFHLDKEIQV